MIELCRRQRNFGDGLIAEEVGELWEDWMRHVDEVLEEAHELQLRRVPRLVTADAAFFSAENGAAAHDKGVKRVAIPNRSTKSPERRKLQKKRWFRKTQKWRTGSEGRISVLKRRHGLN